MQMQLWLLHTVKFKGIEKFEKDLSTLYPILTECRVMKTRLELSVIQLANDINSKAHIEVMRNTRIGMKEYQLESMFLHQTYMYGGCRNYSYTCICVTGDNSVILHYGRTATPNEKTLEDGDMALLDMGAEFHFYGSDDIRYLIPVNGKFIADQCLVYNAVLSAHNDVISLIRPGVSWVDIHKLAERVIIKSLRNGSILYGDVDEMMLGRLGAVFMPHGLGHLLGTNIHDTGGYAKDVDRPKEPGLKSTRTARKLEQGRMLFY